MTAVAPLARPWRPARALRLEIRRSVVPWAIPLIAALFFFDVYRTAAGDPPLWNVRACEVTNHMLFDFSAFAAGLGAWAGSREGRRKTGDLVATTVRPAWARQAAALAATLFWLVLAFLAGVVVIYVQTALGAAWGGPPLWPAAVGVAGVVTACVTGFTAGVLFPGRFTAPLAAVGVLVLAVIGFHAGLGVSGSDTYGLLSPATGSPPVDYGIFYRVPPDVAIAQVMFMGGITLAMLGLLTLAPVFPALNLRWHLAVGRAGRWLCVAGAALLAAGLAASWTAYALTGTARVNAAGYWVIPALHDAASDQPAAYTPDCTGTAFKVCVHPAFGGYLSHVAAALDPVAAEIAGLPGAPAGAREVVSDVHSSSPANPIMGNPPVFTFTSDNVGNLIGVFRGSPAGSTGAIWNQGFQQGLLDAFVTGQPPAGLADSFAGVPTTPAQQAVVKALLTVVGTPASQLPQLSQSTGPNGQPAGPSPAKIAAAAQRFAALSPAARHAWLATRLAALRAGTISLGQIP
jgi:hypothetical protein